MALVKIVLIKIFLISITLFAVSVAAFSMIRMVPGDPVMLLLGERGASAEVYQEMRENLGIDQSVFTQYWLYSKKVLSGDLGISIISKRPVLEEFFDRFPATLELGCVALFLAIILGIPLGILAAVFHETPIDYTLTGASLVGYSMPIFWWGLVLILIFSVTFELTPVSGRIHVLYDIPQRTGFLLIDTLLSEEGWPAFFDACRHLLLPTFALATIPLAVITRMTRSSILEVLGQDYIRTAQAKGLSPIYIVTIHALRNAMIPINTVIGLMFGTMITGAILTETIFSWPGIGTWLVRSVTSRDYPVIQGGILLIAIMVIAINTGIDTLNTFIDPKLRDL